MRAEGRSPSILKYSEGLVLRSAGARPLVLKGELVRMSDWAHGVVAGRSMRAEGRSPSVLKYSEGLVLISAGARPLVLKGELVRMSDWAHGVSSWARLCKL